MAISIDAGFEDGRYYIVSNEKVYDAEDINITNTNRIELLKDDKWFMLD